MVTAQQQLTYEHGEGEAVRLDALGTGKLRQQLGRSVFRGDGVAGENLAVIGELQRITVEKADQPVASNMDVGRREITHHDFLVVQDRDQLGQITGHPQQEFPVLVRECAQAGAVLKECTQRMMIGTPHDITENRPGGIAGDVLRPHQPRMAGGGLDELRCAVGPQHVLKSAATLGVGLPINFRGLPGIGIHGVDDRLGTAAENGRTGQPASVHKNLGHRHRTATTSVVSSWVTSVTASRNSSWTRPEASK